MILDSYFYHFTEILAIEVHSNTDTNLVQKIGILFTYICSHHNTCVRENVDETYKIDL